MEGISYTNMGREIGFPGSPPESSNSPPLPKRVPFFLVLLLSVLHFSLLLHFFPLGLVTGVNFILLLFMGPVFCFWIFLLNKTGSRRFQSPHPREALGNSNSLGVFHGLILKTPRQSFTKLCKWEVCVAIVCSSPKVSLR